MNAPSKSAANEAGNLGVELTRFNRVFRSEVERALKDLELSTSEYTALSVIDAHPHITSARLARAMMISRQVAGRTVAELVTADLAFAAHSPSGRTSSVSITERGTRILSDAHTRVSAVEAHILGPLSNDESSTLIAAMRRCADAAGLQLLPSKPGDRSNRRGVS